METRSNKAILLSMLLTALLSACNAETELQKEGRRKVMQYR